MALALALALVSQSASAQPTYPTRPISFVLPFSAAAPLTLSLACLLRK
jgi:tripartite-type tricarboxylate transporter receptor subunit TctC